MLNFGLIARQEFRKMIGTRTFLATTIGVPLLIVVMIGIGVLATLWGRDDRPIGIVDQAGILVPGVVPANQDDLLTLITYADETAAHAALAAQQIQAYYLLPPDYPYNPQIEQYYWEDAPGRDARQTIGAFVQANLISSVPAEAQLRLSEGAEVTTRSADGRREVRSDDFMSVLLPFVAAFLFVFAVIGSAGYLLQVVADEKENRTMEIMVTSVTPLELIGGKALGLMAVTLSQIALWVITIVLGLVVGARYIEALQGVTVPWSLLLVVVLYFLPAFALVAGLMTAIGGAVTQVQQGQQIAGILNLLFLLPLFLIVLFLNNPNSPLLVALTLFPTTSFMTVTMRWGLTVIPTWQLVLSWSILAGTAVLSVWAASHIFRIGMLHYGQPLRLQAVLSVLRAK
jgi:ABC-2 type transport system permease protein